MEYFSSPQGRRVSKFCFGCEALGGDDWGKVNVSEISAAIALAADQGVNFFDTADVYGLGLSESRLADALGSRRHELVIASKFGVRWEASTSGGRARTWVDNQPEYLQKAVSASLRRLRLDQLPVGYLHWPDESGDIRPAVECMAKMREDGQIGHLGLANVSGAQLSDALEISNIDFLQTPCNILHTLLDVELAEQCRKAGVAIVAYNVLASGLLSGKYDMNTRFDASDRRSRRPEFVGDDLVCNLQRVEKIKKIASSEGVDCRTFAIQKVFLENAISACILGCKNIAQAVENIDVFVPHSKN